MCRHTHKHINLLPYCQSVYVIIVPFCTSVQHFTCFILREMNLCTESPTCVSIILWFKNNATARTFILETYNFCKTYYYWCYGKYMFPKFCYRVFEVIIAIIGQPQISDVSFSKYCTLLLLVFVVSALKEVKISCLITVTIYGYSILYKHEIVGFGKIKQ